MEDMTVDAARTKQGIAPSRTERRSRADQVTIREAIHAELLKLQRRGKLTPKEVVRSAANPSNPLHLYARFVWDDKTAGHLYRLDQARELIRDFQITYEYSYTEYRLGEFVRDPRQESDKQGYERVSVIRSSRSLKLECMRQEMTAALGHIDRLVRLAQYLGYGEEVAEMKTLLERLMERLA